MSSVATNHSWPEVRIGDVLTYLDERVDLNDADEYITITVKRRHGGLEERERLLGHQISTKKQFRLIPGAFIISRVQCWHEAYAIVPNDIPFNMIASINYDQFAVSPKVDQRFFWWLSHAPYFTETVRSSAFGVVIEKMVFNRGAWLEKRILLPPLDEQVRIATQIEELGARIDNARQLRSQAAEEVRALFAASLDLACLGGATEHWRDANPNVESARELLDRIAKQRWPGHVASRARKPSNCLHLHPFLLLG